MQDANDRAKHHGHVNVTAHVVGHSTQVFDIGSEATLLEVMEQAATLGGFALLPPRQRPFDHLHAMNGEQVGPVIEPLDQSLEEYLHHADHLPHFTLELARAIHVNTRWDVAPEQEMAPREILALSRIHLDHTQFTLYRPESTVPLPLETPITLERGTDLEAQRDGKYGGGH